MPKPIGQSVMKHAEDTCKMNKKPKIFIKLITFFGKILTEKSHWFLKVLFIIYDFFFVKIKKQLLRITVKEGLSFSSWMLGYLIVSCMYIAVYSGLCSRLSGRTSAVGRVKYIKTNSWCICKQTHKILSIQIFVSLDFL